MVMGQRRERYRPPVYISARSLHLCGSFGLGELAPMW
tara:strand:+ start:434 stop:544 length:111 start_codon:yes stop_codon:yes gene_type:complete